MTKLEPIVREIRKLLEDNSQILTHAIEKQRLTGVLISIRVKSDGTVRQNGTLDVKLEAQ